MDAYINWLGKIGDGLAAAVDVFDEVFDRRANDFNGWVVATVKRLIERLNKIGGNELR